VKLIQVNQVKGDQTITNIKHGEKKCNLNI